MSCQNCYNGCSEITPDRCIRYTGDNIPSLGIETGDSLSKIELSLSTFLISTLNGTGIHPTIDPDIICALVGGYLPTCEPLTIVDFVNALIKASCNLQEQIIEIDQTLATIEADYTVGCLAAVIPSSGTHAILQAVITKLCATSTTLTALALTLSTNYSSNGSELDAYIANYLANNSTGSTLISNKMVPYVAYPYFGTLTNFDANGVGISSTDWAKIYLCNGYLGKTPDMRGRVPVAATSGPGPAIVDPIVNPGGFNPAYNVGGSLYGVNSIILDATTVPNHSHTATAIATQIPHFHYEFATDSFGGTGLIASPLTYTSVSKGWNTSIAYVIEGNTVAATIGKTNTETPAITASVTVAPTANGGNGHSNIQPSIACYFIMYIP